MTANPLIATLLRYCLIIVLIAMSFESKSTAQTAVSDDASVIDTAPSQNPWESLEDMPGNLGRFVLASDQQQLYRLGGISFKIRRGQRYGHHFAAFDPSEQKWEKLPSTPLGTGGAQMASWPANESLVMIGGIKKLGDSFSDHAITIGTYSVAAKRWTTNSARCRGLGRIAAMIHLNNDRFLLIAGDDALNAHRTAILEMGGTTTDQDRRRRKTPVVTIVGEFPQGGRIIGIAITGETISVLQSDDRDTRLQRFSAASGKHVDSIELSIKCDWTDKLFSWNGNLLIWKNSGPSQPQNYQHASQLLLIDPVTGQCNTLHPEHPGPTSRRSSDGIVMGDSFYVFGGQRENEVWLKDAHRYRFRIDNGSDTTRSTR